MVELPSKIDCVPVEGRGAARLPDRGRRRLGRPARASAGQVLRDVRRDLVSVEAAERDYGVVIRGDTVDEQATVEKRAAQRAERGAPPQFDFGELPEGVTVG